MKQSLSIAVALLLLLLSGCSHTPQALEEASVPLSQMEPSREETDALPSGGAHPPAEPETSDSPDAGAASSEPDTAPRDDATYPKTAQSYDLASLETAVVSIGSKVESATVTGDAQADRDAFLALHNELEDVENQVDDMEDLIEWDARNGDLSLNDYRTLDERLDLLDNQLDRLEEQLELLFKTDD